MDPAKSPIASTTRIFDTTQGTLTYAQLSDVVAPKLLALQDDINDKKYIQCPFNEELIQEFHRRIVGDVMPEIAGRWRTQDVRVGNWLPPAPYEVPMMMREYAQNVQARISNVDEFPLQIEALAYAEGEFLHIHPFQDFNGRTIRAILSELMTRLVFPPVETFVERDTLEYRLYQNALAEYDNGRIFALVEFWQKRLDMN